MAECNNELHAKRCEHIIRDWEAAWGVRQRLDGWLHLLRTGSVTVVLGYVGFITASNRDWTGVSYWLVWLPSALLILVFFLLELSMRAQTYFYRDHIRQIDDLFSKSNHLDFEKAVKGHEFLGQRENGNSAGSKNKSKDRWPRLCKALHNPSVWLWYAVLWLVTGAVVYCWVPLQKNGNSDYLSLSAVRAERESGRLSMALWVIVLAMVLVDVAVGVVGLRRKSGAWMVASGAWALFLVGCGFAVNFDDAFILFAFPVLGAYGVTILALGLKALLR